MAPLTDTFDLGTLRLASGEGAHVDLEVAVDPLAFGGQTYTVPGDRVPVRVARKKALPWASPVDWRLTGISVEFDKEDDYYGFEIDGNHLFLLADCTVTHNTAFVVSAMRNAAVDFKKPVAIFSLEMSSLQLVNRLISAEAELDS